MKAMILLMMIIIKQINKGFYSIKKKQLHTYPLTAIQLLHAKKTIYICVKQIKIKTMMCIFNKTNKKTLEEEDEELIKI